MSTTAHAGLLNFSPRRHPDMDVAGISRFVIDDELTERFR
jgi:hypothetical protein